MPAKKYIIRKRFLVRGEGWKIVDIPTESITYEAIAHRASVQAQDLDAKYGDDHFWTVDLINPETDGSYFQLFHGRLS